MRSFIVRHPLAFLAGALGAVVAATGLGSVALGAGAPLVPFMYLELGLYLVVPFAVAFGVPEREGGAVAMAISAALPLLGFFAWLQHRVAGNLAGGFVLAALGASIVLLATYAPQTRTRTKPALSATPRSLVKRSA